MITRLKKKDTISVLNFVNTYNDNYMDFYFTFDKERVFLKSNLKLVEKILKYQEVYGIVNKDVEALMIVYKEKGFRPYVKILGEEKYNKDLIKYLKWNFKDELFIKIKERNPLLKELVNTIRNNGSIKYFGKKGFVVIGLRGKEILIKKNKQITKEIKYATH